MVIFYDHYFTNAHQRQVNIIIRDVQQAVLLAIVTRETIFGNIWRSINFNPYQLCPKPRNPTDTYYGTLSRVLALRPPLLLK